MQTEHLRAKERMYMCPVKSLEEVYLEHFGMMDDLNYVNTAIYKLNTYERNGIYLGVNLFLTYETSRKPLNVRALDEMIKALWIEEPIIES